jgi:hypothetical protein
MATIKSLGKIEKTLTKSGIIAVAKSDANEVIESDHYDLLKVYIELKRYEQYLETVIETIKPLALSQASLLEEKTYSNAKVSIQNRLTYDFSNDRKWLSLKESAQGLQNRLKDHESILKCLTEPTEIVDEETGEFIQVEPPLVEHKQILVVTI